MNKIHILDCTLRDGGYCNQWKFGYDNIKKIMCSLSDAGIEIIECGFISNKVKYNSDITKFTSVKQISEFVPKDKGNKIYVAMINYGEYDSSDLPQYDGSSIDGVRVAFHKKDMEGALLLCREIQKKGYKVFIQPMVSLSYSDEEFLKLIYSVNEFKPYAFYIVDSFGMMKKKNLIRLFYLVEHNLNDDIWIGFHSHNNKQLAYSNAQCLVDAQTTRNLIIDASVFGMGRGAGNLNTELMVEYLNENVTDKYQLNPLLHIIDEVINEFYMKNYWGYSVPNYLSAAHSTHPNYAGYLADKNTLTIEAMNEIFLMMSDDKKSEFDKEYIEELYVKFMDTGKVQEKNLNILSSAVGGKKILLIAPGKSSEVEKDKIIEFCKNENVIPISINFEYQYVPITYIFTSNLRRFREIKPECYFKCITTSNIPVNDVYVRTRYYDLLMDNETIKDNAGLMAIKFFSTLGVEQICLAGFDGYSYDYDKNYVSSEMTLVTKNALIDGMNHEMSKALKFLSKNIELRFVTTMKHIIL